MKLYQITLNKLNSSISNMARYCMPNNNNTRIALRVNTGNCVFFQCTDPPIVSLLTGTHVTHRHPEWKFKRPFSTLQNRLSSLSTKWLQYGTKIFCFDHYLNKHTSIHTFTQTHRTEALLAHTEALGQQGPQRGTIVCFSPEEMFAALLGLAIILKKKNHQSRGIWRFYSDMLKEATLCLRFPPPYLYVLTLL